MQKLFDSLKYIKLKDLFAPFIFLLAIIPGLICKAYFAIKKKPLWLICEDGNTARDNGYYFYKYMREKHPEVNCKYVIRKKSCDYDKIKKLGLEPVEMSSFRHYVLYLAAKWNISNHKHGNPNQPFFYVVHVILGLINNRVFLQHGVIKDDIDCYHYESSKFRYFVTTADREYEYIKKQYGYKKDEIIKTGLPRFDTLIDESKKHNQILIMPTWRNWLGRETNSLHKQEKFTETDYFKNWNGLLTNKGFIEYIEKNNIKVLFCPHQHMQKYLDCFNTKSKKIKIVDMNTDIQKVLRESKLLITDYSSVFMDFAYMEKPVIYFHFDYKRYREGHLKQGYFDYKKDGFGPICETDSELLECIKSLEKYRKKYLLRESSFFGRKDSKNSERLYRLLKK